MTLLLTALLTLIPLTVSAESRGGLTVGPSTGLHPPGTHGLGLHGPESRTPDGHFPHVRGFHGRAIRPMLGSGPAQNLTTVNIQVERPEEPSPPPPKPSPPAKFWIARCGSFVELQAGPTLNLIEEEGKSCPD
ncbi:MAG: hypothetical protein OEV53_12835 [Nitrospira sp.]|nr:hypothetical protein [Nitrospira sp.]MDH5195067.1 hypothetical protein [Nitrospira sp.]